MTRIFFFISVFLSFSFFCVARQNDSFAVAPIGYVNDFEEVYAASDQLKLTVILKDFEKKSGIEIVVVTLKDAWITETNFDSLVIALHNEWGIGKKEKNNGILVGFCKRLRKIRISTGEGVRRKLTDAEAKKIIDNEIAPEFRKGNFFLGTKKAILAMIKELRG